MSQHTRVQEVITTDEVVMPTVETEHPVKTYEKKKAIFRTYQVIWYVLGVIEVLLVFRVLLKLVSANPLSSFVDLIYTLSSPFAMPFQGVLGTSVTNGSVVEWSTFVAMIVYVIVALGVVELMQFIKPTSPEEVRNNVDSV